ncbi:MAG: tRNA (N6-isopentenyl adenosine(37)-C2)-methylthiotransferase MiaB [Acidobacteria bacterium]|nr:MAG: tRNA (N6-isopentenyl adenosine(37)-C2)-methylthiotransferase MiaB [Acidobacteriota bacterium]
MKKKYYIETWGCQMNVHDSEKIAGTLSSLGYSKAETIEQADVYLMNTCTIREKAKEKIFSRIGVVKELKKNRDLKIGVAGCVAQQEGRQIFSRAPQVDFVMGTQALQDLPELLLEKHACSIEKHPDNHLFPTDQIVRKEGLKAQVTIMEGCDNFCSYCIVPYTRGRERSRNIPDILYEIRNLVSSGFVEIELLGQNVNSYNSEVNFATLLKEVSAIGGVEMLRFISPHPKDFNIEVIDIIRDNNNIGTGLHLPAQSGNTRILKRMGRDHTREHYLQLTAMIQEKLPECSLTSDFIVGFPGETEAEFLETVSLIEEVGYDRIFSFMYSPRPGTRAVQYGDPIPKHEKAKRLQYLQTRQAEIQKKRMSDRIGKRDRILVDRLEPEDQHPLAGRNRENLLVHVQSEVGDIDRFIGRWIDVDIVGAGMHTLRGKLL